MSFTIGDIEAAAQARGYGADTAAQQLVLTQAVLRRISTARRWNFMRSNITVVATVANATVAIASPVERLEAVRLTFGTDRYNLVYKHFNAFRQLSYVDRVPSVPRYWTLVNPTSINLWPLPDKAYTVDGDGLTKLVVPTDTTTPVPGFPDSFQDAASYALCAELAGRQRDWNAANYWNGQYSSALAELVRADAIKQRQTPDTVAESPFWDNVSR